MKSSMGFYSPHLIQKRTRKHMKHLIEDDAEPRPSKNSRKVIFSDKGVHEKHRTSTKRIPHPLYSSFKDRVHDYQSGAAASRSQQLQETFDALEKRLDRKDVDEDYVKIPEVPKEEDIEALNLETKTLTLPFEEETMTHKKIHSDGTEGLVDIKLRDRMESFAKKIAQKRSDLDRLLSSLDEVRSEIRTARNDIILAEEIEAKLTSGELEKELRGILKDAESAKDLTFSEVSAGRNEDQMLKAEASRKFQELVNAFSS